MMLMLDCNNLSHPTTTEIGECVTYPSPPRGQYSCTGGECVCKGASECHDMGAEKDCKIVTCNKVGCVGSGCVDRKEP